MRPPIEIPREARESRPPICKGNAVLCATRSIGFWAMYSGFRKVYSGLLRFSSAESKGSAKSTRELETKSHTTSKGEKKDKRRKPRIPRVREKKRRLISLFLLLSVSLLRLLCKHSLPPLSFFFFSLLPLFRMAKLGNSLRPARRVGNKLGRVED